MGRRAAKREILGTEPAAPDAARRAGSAAGAAGATERRDSMGGLTNRFPLLGWPGGTTERCLNQSRSRC
ncbi:hypothetical protein BN381_300005 [Candidatus Microthrix parvicella RN1]|uniref:Uncharacterized protein n=1 Tax=Candidatus Neomicrothrix parvicella RN1 TaxID=1229780 RepID=R4YZH3_9ACTN|nr:hypothetical protein BN381_300005 [Candidatus Microthrix parvicella RN1]